MAHEYLQSYQAQGVRLRDFQIAALEDWVQEYRGDLGVALTDTVGMDAFLADFDMYFAKLFDGLRHDSGDPYAWGEKAIAHYQKLRIDPQAKRLVFSDGLDLDTALALYQRFADRIQLGFGIGTRLTNDMGLETINIVMKLTHANGQPVAKISDSPGKTLCNDENLSGLSAPGLRPGPALSPPDTAKAPFMLRITIAQLNPTVGDIAGNVARMARGRCPRRARAGRPAGLSRAVAVRLLPWRPAGRARLSRAPGARLAAAAAGHAPVAAIALGHRRAHARQRARQAAAQQPAGAQGRCGAPALRQAAAAHLQHLRRTPPLRARPRRGQGAAHRPGPGGLSGVRGRLERRRCRLRHQPLRAHGRRRARPGGQHQRQPQPPGQARAAPRDLRPGGHAPRPAHPLREPDRRPGPDRVRRRLLRGGARARRGLRGRALRGGPAHAAVRTTDASSTQPASPA